MKNIFKISLLAALFAVSTAQASRYAFVREVITCVVAYNVFDIACIMNSAGYFLARTGEVVANDLYRNNTEKDLFYRVLPTMRSFFIGTKLDIASRANRAIETFKK